MTALSFDDKVFNREVSFCRVYSLESKEKLEKLFLRMAGQILFVTSFEGRKPKRKDHVYHSDQ